MLTRFRSRLPGSPSVAYQVILVTLCASGLAATLALTLWSLHRQALESALVDLVSRQVLLQHRHLNEILLAAQGYPADYRTTRTTMLDALARLRHGGPLPRDARASASVLTPGGPTEEIRRALKAFHAHLRETIAKADAYLHARANSDSSHPALEELVRANRRLSRITGHTMNLYQVHLAETTRTRMIVTMSVAIGTILAGALTIHRLTSSAPTTWGRRWLRSNRTREARSRLPLHEVAPDRERPAASMADDRTKPAEPHRRAPPTSVPAPSVPIAIAERRREATKPTPSANLRAGFEGMIGRSPRLLGVCDQIEKVAGTDATVLLTGETGTGKELAARAIHRLSPRRDHVFMMVNCANLPAPLIESELFGHEKGAFTSAASQVKGRFELANGGTLVLDEIAELPLETQSKLLRVLQDRQFERLGGTHTIRVNVRVIAATNRRLEDAVRQGAFRPDLFFRLNTFPIAIPPLRERKEDIPPLAAHFLTMLARELGKPVTLISPAALDRLMQHEWPGNVRELANAIERAIILCDGPTLLPRHFEGLSPLGTLPEWREDDSLLPLREAERIHILNALQKTHGVVGGPKGAAALLGLNRNTLLSRMKKLGMTPSKHRD